MDRTSNESGLFDHMQGLTVNCVAFSHKSKTVMYLNTFSDL